MNLALVGRDVSRSLSRDMHAFILERMGSKCSYAHISVGPGDADETFRKLLSECDGFNVTVPYKLAVIPHLAALSEDAARYGAVNTVVCRTRTGYNTDGAGFSLMLRAAGVETAGRRALVLGAGGAARSVACALADAGAEVAVWNRTRERAADLCARLKCARVAESAEEECDILINATACGMGAQEGMMPCSERAAAGADALVDLIYVPQRTAFLAAGARAGKKTVNGLAMLFYQAYYADCLYLGAGADESEAVRLYGEYMKKGERQ